ncbi:energy-coupling factor ABC transporter substrate-binding protein [Parathermosynechococcus lividus]
MVNSKAKQVWLLLGALVLLGAAPLLLINAEFEGADAQAEDLISEMAPEYTPWARPVFKPQSAEVESLLFVLQASLGAGVLGFVVGQYTERHRQKRLQIRREK